METIDEHQVLINEEEQYSLWPAFKDCPAGWTVVFSGTKAQCLEYVRVNWTDMRPKSLRLIMEKAQG